jgi:hypothetical protein
MRDSAAVAEQRFRLEKEGLRFSRGGIVDLDRFRWDGGGADKGLT